MSDSQIVLPLDRFDTPLVQGNVKTMMRETKTSSRDLWQVAVSDINRLDNFNVRIRDDEFEAHIQWLEDQMVEHGYDQESVMKGFVARESGDTQVIYVKDGHCRLEAIERANKRLSEDKQIVRVPMVVAAQGTSIEDMTIDLVLHNGGKQLRPYEQAIVIKRLIRYGMDEESIAKRLGIDVLTVNGLLLLAGAPPEIRDMVIAGQVAATTAIAEMRKNGGKAVERLKAGLVVARANGRERVTAKHLPGNAFKKAVTKQAVNLYNAAKSIKSDPAYQSLSPENQTLLQDLLKQLEAAEMEMASQDQQSQDQAKKATDATDSQEVAAVAGSN
ncbi:ParB/RepB/Spo0J family partition protein [Chromobacterium haemolyticum]|uniref:ParB/RepB/Spo0J family partition protein n=1 Tax=Chromobacterium haemolyticum TaxID=394935 RepID=UPI00244C6F77|nr:hypothetical protein [Chromobacterium haemolyticum]MDH0341985.1 hypothetical protein [Chromobacterium haemolyticum]